MEKQREKVQSNKASALNAFSGVKLGYQLAGLAFIQILLSVAVSASIGVTVKGSPASGTFETTGSVRLQQFPAYFDEHAEVDAIRERSLVAGVAGVAGASRAKRADAPERSTIFRLNFGTHAPFMIFLHGTRPDDSFQREISVSRSAQGYLDVALEGDGPWAAWALYDSVVPGSGTDPISAMVIRSGLKPSSASAGPGSAPPGSVPPGSVPPGSVPIDVDVSVGLAKNRITVQPTDYLGRAVGWTDPLDSFLFSVVRHRVTGHARALLAVTFESPLSFLISDLTPEFSFALTGTLGSARGLPLHQYSYFLPDGIQSDVLLANEASDLVERRFVGINNRGRGLTPLLMPWVFFYNYPPIAPSVELFGFRVYIQGGTELPVGLRTSAYYYQNRDIPDLQGPGRLDAPDFPFFGWSAVQARKPKQTNYPGFDVLYDSAPHGQLEGKLRMWRGIDKRSQTVDGFREVKEDETQLGAAPIYDSSYWQNFGLHYNRLRGRDTQFPYTPYVWGRYANEGLSFLDFRNLGKIKYSLYTSTSILRGALAPLSVAPEFLDFQDVEEAPDGTRNKKRKNELGAGSVQFAMRRTAKINGIDVEANTATTFELVDVPVNARSVTDSNPPAIDDFEMRTGGNPASTIQRSKDYEFFLKVNPVPGIARLEDGPKGPVPAEFLEDRLDEVSLWISVDGGGNYTPLVLNENGRATLESSVLGVLGAPVRGLYILRVFARDAAGNTLEYTVEVPGER